MSKKNPNLQDFLKLTASARAMLAKHEELLQASEATVKLLVQQAQPKPKPAPGAKLKITK